MLIPGGIYTPLPAALAPGGPGLEELGAQGSGPSPRDSRSLPRISGWRGGRQPPAPPHSPGPNCPLCRLPSPAALKLCAKGSGGEVGSNPWPQSLGVACLLPAGKRESGEISAADVPDNTVERQRQQGMCLPDENVLPLLQPDWAAPPHALRALS